MWLYVSPKSNFGAHFDGSSFLLAIDGRNLLPIKWKEHGPESKIHARVSHHPLFFLSLAQYFMRVRDSSKDPLFAPRARPFDLSFWLFPCKRCVRLYPLIWCAAKASLSLSGSERARAFMTPAWLIQFLFSLFRDLLIGAKSNIFGCGPLDMLAASWPQNNLIYALLTIKLTSWCTLCSHQNSKRCGRSSLDVIDVQWESCDVCVCKSDTVRSLRSIIWNINLPVETWSRVISPSTLLYVRCACGIWDGHTNLFTCHMVYLGWAQNMN